MDLKIKNVGILEEKSDIAIFPVFEGEKPAGALADADAALGGIISAAIKSGEFAGKRAETMFFHAGAALKGPARIMLAGLGKKEKFKKADVMAAAGSSAKTARQYSLKELTVAASVDGVTADEFAELWAQGALMGLYEYNAFKSADKDRKEVKRLTLVYGEKADAQAAKAGMVRGTIVAESVCFARDMINAPANEMTPTMMAKQARKASKDSGFKLRVLEARDCEKLGMGAFLGVAKGSTEPPKFMVMEYMGAKKKGRPTVIIGKGITFDSGGISIKPVDGMEKMKYDMAGGGAVIGAMRAIAMLKMPVDVIGLVPATENMPDGGALKPGDVVRSMNGKTTEIISTDAEGRLILSDALCYAARFKPASVIDIATLTGACVIALGDLAIGLMGNEAAVIDRVKKAADTSGELVWELPMWDEFLERMKGDVTDLKNAGGRSASTVTAGKYLQEFVDYPWVHLDIAGTAWEEKGTPFCPKGARGTGVRLILEYLKGLS